MAWENATGPGNRKIVDMARAVAKTAAGKSYKWGGFSTDGFDCSGFVSYVLEQVYPTHFSRHEATSELFASVDFQDVTGAPQYGDLVCFVKGPTAQSNHVGLVVDATHWIGSQGSASRSGGGVAEVSFSDGYWSPKDHRFRRLVLTS